MPDALPKDPRLLVRDVLTGPDWDPTAAASYDPNHTPDNANWLPMSRGWYDSNVTDPSVSLTNVESGPLGGGATGWTGFDGSTGDMNQDRDGTILVTTFAEEGGDYNDELAAADVVWEVRTEIESVIQQNSEGGPTPFRYLGSALTGAPDDTDVSPPVRIEQLEVSFGWMKTTR